MTLPLHLRRAGAGDAEEIARVHVASWQWGYRGLLPDEPLAALTPKQRHPLWRKALGEGTRHRIWLAERDGRGLGFAAWGPPREEAPPQPAELYALYLAPEAAGSGLATALLSAATDEMRRELHRGAFLWVLQPNARARRFYEREGWRPDGGEKGIALLGADLRAVRYGILL